MMKRILSLLVVLALLMCLAPYGKGQTYAAGSDHQAQIDRMNALLNGLSLSDQFTQTDVAQWSDEAVANAIYRKLIWDYQFSDYVYTEKLKADSDDYYVYKLSGLDKLCQSCYGRSFPQNAISHGLAVDGDRVYVDAAAGESTALFVQDFYTQGSRVIAVGVAAYFGGPIGAADGYFQAEFRKNENSIYGLTLISLKEIRGNQDFSNLIADASSELKETTVTHYAQRVLDNKLNTAWVEAAQGVGVGQWIRIANPSGEKLELIGMELNLGYQIDQRRLDNNGWPTEVLVECEGGYSQKATLHYYDAVILLDEPVKTSWVKLTILDAEPGEKYEDTCISEIRLLGLAFTQMIPEETPDATEPPSTTPQSAQPTQPQPTKTQPARPEPTAPQGQSSEGKAETGSGLLLTVIVAAVALAVGVAMGLLLKNKKKKTAAPQGNFYGNSQMYPPYYPQSAPQSWQNPPNAAPNMPPDAKDSRQGFRQDALPKEPQNPWQQEQP